MGRNAEFTYRGKTSSFELARLDRSKLYGRKTRVWLDGAGRECEEARLTADGLHILPKGAAARLYVDGGGESVPPRAVTAAGMDGARLDPLPPTVNAPQEVSGPVPIEDFLNHTATAVYELDAVELSPELESELERGAIFRVPFRMRAAWRDDPAFLLMNDEGVFLIAAEPAEFDFAGRESAAMDPPDADTFDSGCDDFDFGQL